jgi:hypothetical protein
VQQELGRGPNNFLLFPSSFSLTKGRGEIYRLEELVMELEILGVRRRGIKEEMEEYWVV